MFSSRTIPQTGSRYIISVYPQGKTVFSLFMDSGGERILFLTGELCGSTGVFSENALTATVSIDTLKCHTFKY